ncbi:hypothetical protein J1N35_008036 [Gossypium stocksii]|uniref:Uncharacterized protein n=1 Tax=Gossypium stocksii TaxID=47602 RepID=A0A9D4AG47_9ROSI|nr:hypothetical protein J1N35_008036 [Gossypium stocksii]
MYNDDHYFKSYESDQSIDLEPKAPLLDNEAALDSTIDQAIENNNVIEEEKWGSKIIAEEEEAVFIGEDKVLYVPDIGESEKSIEELNKRFDDFITKMKEELRIEARQQLVTV